MSSNAKVDKICIFCEGKLVAKTFSTKYCSHKYDQRDYNLKVSRQFT